MPENNHSNLRREKRLPVDSLILPFLGTRVSDQQTFQYIILDTSRSGAGIAIPKWVIAREKVNSGEQINLHLPFRFAKETFNRGTVAWERWQDDIQAQKLGVHLDQKVPGYYPVLIDLDSGNLQVDLSEFESESDLLVRVIKDAFLLKKGVRIYFHHLVPYFSRVAGVSAQEYAELKDALLVDIGNRIEANLSGLEELHQKATTTDLSGGKAAAFLDLEELRVMVDSEFYSDLFSAAFPGDLVGQYIRAIKILEQRLFYNYNTAVMLYIRSANLS